MTTNRTRIAVAVGLCFASALVTVLLLQDWLSVTVSSDAHLQERFRGAAFEDVFGFGFWPTFFATAFAQVFLIAGSWYFLRGHRLRGLVLVLALVFAAVSVLEYRAFQREFHEWSTQ